MNDRERAQLDAVMLRARRGMRRNRTAVARAWLTLSVTHPALFTRFYLQDLIFATSLLHRSYVAMLQLIGSWDSEEPAPSRSLC